MPDINDNAFMHLPLEETGSTEARLDVIGSKSFSAINTPGSGTGKIGSFATDLEDSNSEFLNENGARDDIHMDATQAIRAWVRPESLTASHHYVLATKSEFEIVIVDRTPRKWEWWVKDTAGNWGNVQYADIAPGTAEWFHIFCYYDFANDEIGLQINDGARETSSMPGSEKADFTDGQDCKIGFREDAPSDRYWDGLVDDIILWRDYIPSKAEVDSMYQDETSHPFPSGGVSFWNSKSGWF